MAGVVLAGLASLALGSLSIPLRDVVGAFTAFDGSDAHVVIDEGLRLPRTELALLVGAAAGRGGRPGCRA